MGLRNCVDKLLAISREFEDDDKGIVQKAKFSSLRCRLLEDIAGGASFAVGRRSGVECGGEVCLKTLVGCPPVEDEDDDGDCEYSGDDDRDRRQHNK